MVKRALFLFLSLQFTATRASATSAFETARTLPDGANRFHFGINLTSGGSSSGSGWAKAGELGFRLGLSRQFDLGASFTIPEFTFDTPSAELDVRFQLVSVQGFAMNLGLGISYTFSTVTGASLSIIGLLPELNLGYDFNQYVAIYLAGRDQLAISARLNGTAVSTNSLFSTVLGFRFGDTWGLRAEGGLYFSGGSSGAVISAALFVGSGNRLALSTETNRRAENWKDRQTERAPRERAAGRSRAARVSSKVMKVRASSHIALLSQPEGNPWRIGDKVCVFRGTESVTCGTVTKADSSGAVLSYASGNVVPGLEATASGAEPPKPRGREAPPSDKDDLGDLQELP